MIKEIENDNNELNNICEDCQKEKDFEISEEIIEINNKEYQTLHFNFSSTDKKLKKDKKLNTDVWYDEETLNWVKASFEKKGKWVYKLVSIR